jgi:tetratricopeptide (TPR) repeat protein
MEPLTEARELFFAALALQENGKLEAAEAQYRKALALAPERASIMNNLAAVLVQMNKCDEAQHLCERLLELNAGDALALLNLGHCQLKLGACGKALASYEAALKIAPESADAHLGRGNALLRLDRPEEAATSYGHALAIKPDDADAHYCRGVAMLRLGKLVEAVTALSAAADGMPDNADVHTDLGMALTFQARHADAEASFRRAVSLEPGDPGIHLNLGNALAEMGKHDEALACYRKMLELDPGLGAAHFSIGRLYERQGRLGDAQAAYHAALGVSPDHVGALNNLGAVYQAQGLHAEATSCYRKVLAIEPGHAQALNNLGNILTKQEQHEEAARLYEKALESHPGDPAAYTSLGELRSAQCRYAEARALLEKAATLNPREPSIFFNLALVRLFQLDFEDAWTAFERRLECQDIRKVLRGNRSSQRKTRFGGIATVEQFERLPRWQGPQEAGVREVAIWAEQGIGDQILYSTLIPELIKESVPFIYEVDRRLLGAYQRSFPAARFVPFAEPPADALQQAERVLLAGSLPALFRRSRQDFVRQPRRLLGARPDRLAHYRARLQALGPGRKIALSWRSRSAVTARPKSTDLIKFAPLLKLPGAHFVDVQYGDTVDERRHVEHATGAQLLHFDEIDYFNDLEDLLAILEACDLLITTSNATAHFAGALGKRAWLLYPGDRAPFFYWAHGGSYRSLWYPAVEIVTAAHLDEWQPLIGDAAARLAGELR